MGLLVRVYFNAVFGGLGGLLGWLLFGVFGDKSSPNAANQALLGGALIGGFIGYLVVSVDAIRDRSFVRFCRLASYGVVLGAAGGALGLWAGESVHFALVGKLASWHTGAWAVLRVAGEVVARGFCWMLLGVCVGLSEGVAARSLGKLSYGTLGGAIGGFVGGALYDGLLKILGKGVEGSSGVLGGALSLVILGACIGAFSALVQGVFQPASIKVLRGWQEGREYPLLKSDNLLGRDEAADIALFRDMRVEKRHAMIQRTGNQFVLRNPGSPPEQTRVNDAPVNGARPLQDGDRIQLGNILLRFQMRAARSGKGVRPPKITGSDPFSGSADQGKGANVRS
jgi:hypothetical protein